MSYRATNDEDYPENFPLTEAYDKDIVMHREAHFAGSFDAMIRYYEEGSKGVIQEFDLRRIQELVLLEKELKQNLAPLLLSGADAEKIAEARNAYKSLRNLYEKKESQSPYPRLIADLILSEAIDPEEEIAAVVAKGKSIVPFLIDLIKSESFYDPLFPGFGQAPTIAAKCLGKIGDKSAIIILFEALGRGDFFDEEALLKALQEIGEPAKIFLLKIVKSHPITTDNETAAMALASFKADVEIAQACLKLLDEPGVISSPIFSTYLVLACKGLQSSEDKELFIELSQRPSLPSILREDIKVILHSWNQSE